jgi:aconitate hydratase
MEMEKLNVSQKLIKSHLINGEMIPDKEIGIKIDHILQQDATGTLIMLELEAININRVKTELAVQYVDHNIIQTDYKNADDHLFLQTAAKKFGYWYSKPGNGVSHVVNMERFGVPGKTLLGSDSHTCSAGCIGMLAIGTGGLDVALVASGEPYFVKMPKIFGIELKGKPKEWVSSKDVILEMLRRFDVKGGVGYILEYFGDGLKNLGAWDRHVISNMGAELGATTTVFPSDEITRNYLKQEGRESSWIELKADEGAEYDHYEELILDDVEPLIALPSSPGNVVTVRSIAGKKISQVVIGSSANPGLRDFWIAAQIVKGRTVHPDVSLDINPTSRQKAQNMSMLGSTADLFRAGARIHQSGCMGCIGMGQAPATGKNSLRTVPRNFPGRSGTLDDQVYLCSPETGAVSALTGEITDPRDFAERNKMHYPIFKEEMESSSFNESMLIKPSEESENVILEKGPNIKSLPNLEKLQNSFEIPVILKMGDNISTDEILRAGAEVLPLRSNIDEISKYAFQIVDPDFYIKAGKAKQLFNGHLVIAGENYAQGSSREHAALAPRFLGQKVVIAKSYARIGWQNLINFGVIPFEFTNKNDYNNLDENDILEFSNLIESIRQGNYVLVKNKTKNIDFNVTVSASERQRNILLVGGIVNFVKERLVVTSVAYK